MSVVGVSITNCLQETSPGTAAKLFFYMLCGVGQSTINVITYNDYIQYIALDYAVVLNISRIVIS